MLRSAAWHGREPLRVFGGERLGDRAVQGDEEKLFHHRGEDLPHIHRERRQGARVPGCVPKPFEPAAVEGIQHPEAGFAG